MIKTNSLISRRTVLAGGAALAGATTLGGRAFASSNLTVGFIYVGAKDDYAYNQAHAEGAAAVRGIEGVKVIEEENVPETSDVARTMQSMIELDGASLIFATSFGYFDPHMLEMAKKYPDVEFRHCGSLWQKDVHPANSGSYFGYIGMAQYLNGIVAGHMTKSKKLGFVAAKPIPQVLLNINSFALGARAVDPEIEVQVIFTGEWSAPVKEAEATNALVASGADVVTCHVDGAKVVIGTAEKLGVYSCGYHTNQQAIAPKGYLTGAEWNWAPVYEKFVKEKLAGQPLEHFVRGGLAEKFVKCSPYGPAVTQAARDHADAVRAEMMKGGYAIINGPLKDNKGNLVVPAGVSYPETAIELESMGYLIEGVIGSLT